MHLFTGRGHQIDLVELRLQRLTAAAGEAAGFHRMVAALVDGGDYVAHRAVDLVEEGVEPVGQGAELIPPLQAEALRQVAFPLGDVAQPLGNMTQWGRDLAGHEPEDQQPQPTDDQRRDQQLQGGGGQLGGQVIRQLVGMLQHRSGGHGQDQRPTVLTALQPDRHQDAELVVLPLGLALALLTKRLQCLLHLLRLGRQTAPDLDSGLG